MKTVICRHSNQLQTMMMKMLNRKLSKIIHTSVLYKINNYLFSVFLFIFAISRYYDNVAI